MAGLPILVVDDDEDIRSMIVEALELEGYRVLGAENGCAALEVLTKQRVALVLFDLRMPVMDGWTFAQILAERKIGVPLVAMTCGQSNDLDSRTLATSAMLEKPFDVADLYRIVRRLYAPRRVHHLTAACV